MNVNTSLLLSLYMECVLCFVDLIWTYNRVLVYQLEKHDIFTLFGLAIESVNDRTS